MVDVGPGRPQADAVSSRPVGPGRPPPRPRSVRWAVAVLGVLVVLLAGIAVLTSVLRDDLVLAWAASDDAAARVVAEGGLEALEASSLSVPAFWPVALACAVLFAALAGVLVGFLREGAGWARNVLTGLALTLGLVGVVSLASGPPGLFVALGLVWLVLDAVLVVLLWHPDTSAYVAG